MRRFMISMTVMALLAATDFATRATTERGVADAVECLEVSG